MVAGAGDDASPRPNFDKSPEIKTNVRGEIKKSNKRGKRMNMAHQSKGCLSGCLLCQSVQWWELQMGCCNNPTKKFT